MTSTITDRVYGESASVAVKAPCVSVSNGAPLPLLGLTPVGGYMPLPGDRILVKDQTDPSTNGIYNASNGAWKRSGDFDGAYDVVQGTLIVVYFPNAGSTIYQLTTFNPIIGTSPLTFASFFSPNQIYPLTGAEAAAGIAPTFFFYPPGDIRRYGALGTGSGDDSVGLQHGVAVLNATTGGNGPPELVLYGWHPLNGTLNVTQNGVAIRGLTSSQGTCGLIQTGNVDTLVFANAVPANGIRNCALYDFTIMSNSGTPTAGRGLVCNYCQNFQVSNFQVVSCYQGVNILGGFGHNWVNTIFLGAAGWAVRQVGTYLLRIEMGPGATGAFVPSEMNFSNFDWKGNTNAGANTLDIAIQITCGDGLFFSNGHCGYAYTADCSITSTAAPAFIDALEFTNVYFDGNVATVGNGVGVQIFGTVSSIQNVKFNTCTLQNHLLHGANISSIVAFGIRFSDCVVNNAAQYGIIFTGGSEMSAIGCTFYNLNTANVAANGLVFTGVTDFRAQNNLLYGNNTGASGFNLNVGISADAASSGGSITCNSFRNCNTPIVCSCGTTTMGLNRLLGAVPTAASAATLPLLQGFDVVQVTGTTTISAGITGANVAESKVVLNFLGALTVNTAANVKLAAGANVAFTAGSMLTLVNDGAFWREAARAVA
jgi:hypothetical protein